MAETRAIARVLVINDLANPRRWPLTADCLSSVARAVVGACPMQPFGAEAGRFGPGASVLLTDLKHVGSFIGGFKGFWPAWSLS